MDDSYKKEDNANLNCVKGLTFKHFEFFPFVYFPSLLGLVTTNAIATLFLDVTFTFFWSNQLVS